MATDHRSLPRNPWVVEKRAGRGCGSAAGRKQGRGSALGLSGLARQGAVGEGCQIRKQAYRKASCPTVGLYMSQPRDLAPKFCCPLEEWFWRCVEAKAKELLLFSPLGQGLAVPGHHQETSSGRRRIHVRSTAEGQAAG